jgi:5S rRNA maturation endonuclease (ribonuclease M5)
MSPRSCHKVEVDVVSGFERLLELLEQHAPVKRQGRNYRTLCPAHDDHHPSLDVADAGDGTPLVVCRSHGCTLEQVCDALGITVAELLRGDDADDGENWTPHGSATAFYAYHDRDGRELFEVARTAGKDFPARRRDSSSRSGWRWNLDGVERVVYRLPQVRAAVAAGEPVYVVEGEKDVHALERLGLVATCNPGGAGKWRDEYADALAGARRVVVLGDDDDVGREHVKQVARSLVGRVDELKVVRLYDLPGDTGRDVSDWIAEQGEDAALALEALVEPTAAYAQAAAEPGVVEFVTVEEFVAHPVPQAEPIVVDAAGSTAIAADGLELTYGDGGAGKTTLWLDGAMHFCAGIAWLGGLITPTRPLRIGWVENEGPQEEFRRKLERKLEAWRGRVPADRFHVLRAPWGALDLRDGGHRAGLAAAVRELDLDLLIAGPLNDLGMVGGGTPDEVRDFHRHLKNVQTLARRLVSLMVLHHENTAGRVSGAWTGRPDLLVHVTAQSNGKTRVFWQKAKWSSSLHRTTSELRWLEHEGFELVEPEANRPERTWEGIEAYVLAHGGTGWGKVAKDVHGTADYLAQRRDAMLEAGVLLNVGTAHAFKLWHRNDPARPLDTNDSDVRIDAELSDSPTGCEGGIGSIRRFAYVVANRSESNRSEHPDRTGAGDPEDDE